jgi:hypothetical protein
VRAQELEPAPGEHVRVDVDDRHRSPQHLESLSLL